MSKFCRSILRHSLSLQYANKTFSNPIELRQYSSSSGAAIMEILSGAGGAEAMLFADDMFNVYSRYCSHKQWPYTIDSIDKDPGGGIRSVKFVIQSPDSFTSLLQEAGVHRVQRVPKTEKHARMHTSTIAIAVTPKSVVDIKVHARDVVLQTMRSSGPGGQHVNKTESAVRLLHKPTGTVVECQETRSQHENRAIAMNKLVDKMRQVELDRILSSVTELRGSQVLSADRNEKIRTYNFPQDRIIDHRIKKTYQNLRSLFGGDMSVLDKMIKDYNDHYRANS